MSDAAPLELCLGETPRFALIWLHGLGADGSDFVPAARALGLATPGRYLFPHAPWQPVTCNGGYEMRSWYDILEIAPDSRRIDPGGLRAAVAGVHRLIDGEVARGIPAERIFIAGFSQGGAVAYWSALSYPAALGGLAALSTYLPEEAGLAGAATPANRALPIFAAHGLADDVVAPRLGERARDFLRAVGYRVDWHDYPMAHEVCISEIRGLAAWLRRQLGEA